MTLFETMNKIEERWKKLEEKLKGPDFFDSGCPLVIDDNRICFNGKRIPECSLLEKIEATTHIETLLKKIDDRNKFLTHRAEMALMRLEEAT